MATKAKRAGEQQVGIRELRQNLSVHLERVKQGERLEVTEHGRPVALLVPLTQQHNWFERMVAEGRMQPARGHLRDLPPPLPKPPGSRSSQEILDEMREDKI